MAEDRGRVHRGTSEFRLKQIELTIPSGPRAYLEPMRPMRMRVESLAVRSKRHLPRRGGRP